MTDPRVGQPINLAEFAAWRWWQGSERHDLVSHGATRGADGLCQAQRDPGTGLWHLGLEWDEPRDIRRVVAQLAAGSKAPADFCVQYWQHSWPTPAPERLPGARRGWIGRDDPWHGRWVTARGAKSMTDDVCIFEFDPIDLAELGGDAVETLNNAEHYGARFRRALKIRLASAVPEPFAVQDIAAYSGSIWQMGQIEVRFSETEGMWNGVAQAYNGYIIGLTPRRAGGILDLLYSCCEADSGERTVVKLDTSGRVFSFLVSDLDHGPIYIPDYGAAVAWAGQMLDWDELEARRRAAPRPLYDRVADEPEHSIERALAEIPPLDVTKQAPFGRYLLLGVEAGRQEFAIRYNGELFSDKTHLKLHGRDAARLIWPSHQLRFCFGSGDPPDFREGRNATQQRLLDGWLPIVISEWRDREIGYTQTTFAALLDGPMTEPEARRGDENVVVMMRVAIRNTTPGKKLARLWLAIAPQEQVALRDGLLIALGRVVPAEPIARQWRTALYDTPCLRCAIRTGGRGLFTTVPYAGDEGASLAISTAASYEVALDGGETHILDLTFPFVSLTEESEWRHVAELRYEDKLADVIAYWRGYIGSGAQIETPDDILGDLHKAVRTHVAISVDKDPESGLVVVPAATWRYPACGNEACWQISMLDQAGHHDRAEAYLETFLRTQGSALPDGRFSSPAGALQGLELDGLDAAGKPVVAKAFGYNLDHGYIMECLANHYRYTGDRAWLDRVAPQLVAACDFVIRERSQTKTLADGQPSDAWGLLPAGHLEDNPEWRYWFAINAHAYCGLKAIAEVLSETGHSEADRLMSAAASYRQDIRKAAQCAMENTPVVRLLDGSSVPHIPTRAELRGREWGWFREAAYGALHLLECDVFDPDEREMTWLLQDLDDNLFPSREWGRPVDIERFWFSHGGITIQPNLMDLAIDYLRREQVKRGLRALFNNLGASLYPDVRAFTEHPVIELGHGVGPFYKAPDESKFLLWLRAFLLREDGDRLWLAQGAPRSWYAPDCVFGIQKAATFFGPMSYRVCAKEDTITVEIAAPQRRLPAEMLLRVRQPDGAPIRRVTINGQPHDAFNAASEIVRLSPPIGNLTVQAWY